VPSTHWASDLAAMHAAELVEAKFLEAERAATRPQIEDLPRDVPGFVQWFEALREKGPGQFDPLFEFLATDATRAQMKWFIKQEFNGEVGFDDLIALTQVRLPIAAKLDLARNFWDEMGNGTREGMHGPMFVEMTEELGIHDTPDTEFVWETLAVANLLTAMACIRRYAWHSLGSLTVTELTSPTRATRVVAGLKRLGLSEKASHYFQLHTTIDVDHWRSWRDEALIPMLKETPGIMVPMAEGALMRMNAVARLYKRYRAELKIGEVPKC
jgi:hypothetical protein